MAQPNLVSLERAESKFQFSLELSGVSGFHLSSVDILEGLSRRTEAEVVLVADEDLDFSSAIGKRALVRGSGLETRTWTLLLGEARFAQERNGPIRYVLHLHDFAWPLGFRLNTRKYRNQSARDIVSLVLGEHQVPHRFELTRETPVRKYCVQYRETDLAFVERLLEFEGIFYRFDEQGVMVLGDNSPSAPEIHDGRTFELLEAAGSLRSEAQTGIYEFRRSARVMTGTVTLGDYNWKHPDVALRQTAYADNDVELARYEFPAGFREPDQGSTLAKLRVEAYRAQAHSATGFGDVMSFAPGYAFTMGNLAADAFAGKYLIVEVHHRYGAEVDQGFDRVHRFSNDFKGIPLERPFRPPVTTARPTIAGSHTAMVRGPSGEEIHTDRYGRFRAQLHWDREAVGSDEDSRWLRVLQETSSSMVLARTGWEMFVAYVDGDPDRPIGVGRAINGEALPTYELPANKNRMTIHTPSSPATGGYSELRMDDSAGAQEIFLRAEKDLDARIKHDKTETIGNNETHNVGTDFKRQVLGDQMVSIGANDSRTYGASSELKVMGSRWITVGGSETVTVGGGQANTVGGSDSERVGAVRISVIGSVRAPDFKAMGKSALQGLIPPQARALQSLVESKNPLQGLASAGTGAADQFVGGLIDGKSTSDAAAAAKASLKGSASGYFPSGDQLKSQFSEAGLTSSIKGAFSSATGGLSDAVMGAVGKGQNGQRDVSFGWAQADALVSLFATGGVSRTAAKSIRKVVGGAYVQAALGPINWSSGAVLMETIGGVKLTKSLRDIGELVEGKLRVNVLGKILRTALVKLSYETRGNSTVKVGGVATYKAETSLEVMSEGEVHISAGSELTVEGGGAAKLKLTGGSATLDTPKLGIETGATLILNGKTLNEG